MLVPFVVRLAPAALVAGRLSGEVEHVTTGDRCAFSSAAQLTAWCAARAADGTPSVVYEVPPDPPDPSGQVPGRPAGWRTGWRRGPATWSTGTCAPLLRPPRG